MWSLILYFLFGIGQPSNGQQGNQNGSTTVQPYGDHGGETETPRPPKG
ncbi:MULTISPECIES: hypothetical protein [Sphingobacterium]|nr:MULTISPECIES: hypothetical protein [Sphingobacterium]